MKGSTAWAHWKNAVEGLESAEILLNHGKYKRSVAEAYYAIETAARASLAEKNVDPRTRKGVWKALNNKLIQSGELPAETADYLARERVKRGAAELHTPQQRQRRRSARSVLARRGGAGNGTELPAEQGLHERRPSRTGTVPESRHARRRPRN